MSAQINYGHMMHRALQGLLRDVLQRVADEGLPGAHHFFITFDTTHPGVDLADWLRERYPEEMTIVMQEWFDNLAVMDDRFAVTLNFGNSPEPMVVPFDAVKTFVDPSVEFGLRFEPQDGPPPADAEPDPVAEEPVEESPPDRSADVVSLDSFRKS
ncbi:SspB family protein [Roseobacter sp. HKCCA0434]|uniref:SspB family protein n=1 Tax=Roseobacter sp. HKCCA0434 TaxID=3079297 RepID=UPI002905E760|nr:ClpXP protease specificity-enhancing factor SspB [Roseobacter sp. HKCCA0434]